MNVRSHAVVLLALAASGVGTVAQAARTDLLHISHVHRGGGAKERPDNTLETFKWCWENGSAVECDCRKTKDGVGIMLHDGTLRRTGRGIPASLSTNDVSRCLTWDEIRDVDVGSYLGPEFAHHRIPTIEATFAAMKGHPTYLAMVDEKGAGPDYIAKKAIEAGVQDQVYYTGQSYPNIVKWNRTLPGGKSLLWIGGWPQNRSAGERARVRAHFEGIMDQLRRNDFRYVTAVSLHTYYDAKDPVDPFILGTDYLRSLIDEFHRHGVAVCSIPFAGGDREECYFKLFELGCDGFSTDYPSVMFSVIRQLKDAEALRTEVGIARAFEDGVRTNEIAGACSVLYDDGVTVEDYVGWADPELKMPMGPDIEFAIYSQTKGMCGALFTTLMDEGRAKLDDPVSKWLPEFADLTVMNNPTNLAAGTHRLPMPITMRHLLTHTSGHGGNGPEKWRRPNMTLREVARTVAGVPWACDPELKYKYSNTGIDIAAAAIEVIAGEPFEVLLQKRILDPCGMRDTTFFPTSNQLARTARFVWPGRDGGKIGFYGRDTRPYNGTAAAAGQGLYSTTADMLRFAKMLMNRGRVGGRQVLSEYAVTNILSRSQTPAGIEQPYSLGMAVEGDWFGHGGAMQTDYRVDWRHRRVKVFMIRQGSPWNPPAKRAWRAGADRFFKDADSHKYDRFRGPTGD